MREALSGLTFRGRCFLAAALASGLSALLLGEKDLTRLAILLSILPLIAIAVVSRTRYQITCARVLNPRRTPVGTEAQVELHLENHSRVPSDTMLLEEHLPPALGPHPRVVLERLSGRSTSEVTYTVRATERGRYPIGPLVIQVSDPFRMCTVTRHFPTNDFLTVMPEIKPLPQLSLTGEYSGSGESRARSVAIHGQDDAATREYRHGDDLRRVHWRSTARTGELMVRR
ncbi:MAG: DUF58 domain-containing protein, partial [Longispora sp.]|nr:DUF58 domain-containing protein [Longispora sp. (in: high G+C Gram-positive bacteria)]